MSTFTGEIEEIRHISVDNFENKDLKCYFLSHCHSDHMRSLENLSQISTPLYTTELSAIIIKKQYPLINIKILEYGFPTNIEFTDDDGKDEKFIVTALNGTGHCLGACMFLFQIEGLDILYTGDFRISLKHARNIKVLNEIKSYGNLMLYMDTTFLNESYTYFPSQQESCAKVIEIIDKHLSKSSSHRVCLQPSARYGYERLLIEIKKRFNEQVYVHEEAVYTLYLYISDLSSCVTRDNLNARIFLKPSYISDDKTSDSNTLTIVLSAMYWKNLTKEIAFDNAKDSNKSIRICYATHNSLSEIEDFLTFLEPKSIKPTVVPSSFREKEIMFSLIRKISKKFKNIESKVNEEEQPKKKFRFKRLREFSSDNKINNDQQFPKKIMIKK